MGEPHGPGARAPGEDVDAPPDGLQEWVDRVAPLLGVDAGLVTVTRDEVLDMVRDVAHGVLRPAAPLTAYVVGIAAGRAEARGADPVQAVRAALAAVDGLISERGDAG